MRTSQSALPPIFRSRLQADLLTKVLLNPEDEWGISDLARALDAAVPTVQREADRLVRAGLLRERRLGRNRLVRADANHPAFHALVELLTVTHGPRQVVAELVSEVRGVEQAYIFGSWAARHAGEHGPPPGDIDVLVVGGADLDDLYDAAQAAEQRLGQSVNVRRVTPDDWAASDDAFLRSIRDRPILELPIESVAAG
ncbi:MAG: ArsR family transcriptional regulator [Actinomycetota bacterium]|jgi:predicted nucleotidyltransferase|nr:ArsR family transcriptional regulator [Actinomycetota bacterium]